MPLKFKTGWVSIVCGVLIVCVLITINYTYIEPHHKATQSFSIGIQNDISSSLIFIADAEHFFQKQGLNVTLLAYPSSKQTLQELLGFKVDLAAVTDIPILIQAFHTPNFSIIATIDQSPSRAEIVARKDRGIRNITDLAGHRLATEGNSAIDYFTYLILQHYKIPLNTVELVYMPTEKLVMALRSGYVDAIVGRHADVEEAVQYFPGRIAYFTAPNLYQVRLNLVAMNSELKLAPKTYISVLTALRMAAAFEQAHPVKAQQDVIHFLGAARREEVMKMWPYHQFGVTLDKNLVASLQQQLGWVIETGKGRESYRPDVTRLVDPLPLASANEVTLNLQPAAE